MCEPMIVESYDGSQRCFSISPLPERVTDQLVVELYYTYQIDCYSRMPDSARRTALLTNGFSRGRRDDRSILLYTLGQPGQLLLLSTTRLHRALLQVFRGQRPLIFPINGRQMQRTAAGFYTTAPVLVGSS